MVLYKVYGGPFMVPYRGHASVMVPYREFRVPSCCCRRSLGPHGAMCGFWDQHGVVWGLWVLHDAMWGLLVSLGMVRRILGPLTVLCRVFGGLSWCHVGFLGHFMAWCGVFGSVTKIHN